MIFHQKRCNKFCLNLIIIYSFNHILHLSFQQKNLMETTNQTNDLFDQQQSKTLPGMLNVLTILTFIGCAISYIAAIMGFFSAANYEKQLADMEEMQDQMGDNELASRMMEGSAEMLQKTYDYRYILLLSGILFTTLCLVGALQMRRLKKSGYTLYVIGELAPIILTAALIGFSLTGGIMILFSAVFAILFVILYTTQRKYLVNP